MSDVPHCLLVVDDAEDNRELLAMCLERQGYRVELAENGFEALQRLRAGLGPCLILLDLMMPVMDGWEFLDAKAADQSLDGVPVLVLSAASDLRKKLEGRAVAGHLEKPIDLDRIYAEVSRLCRHERPVS